MRTLSLLLAAFLILPFLIYPQELSGSDLSQQSYWVSTRLPGQLPQNYEYALGETCMIFADDTSQTVYAFDITYADWQVLLVPTQSDWTDAAADGNVAMIYNDSIVAGYSAVTHSFSAINYTGSLISLSGDEYGCIDNFAFFVTDQLFYVFDAEDAQWHSYAYTPPGSAQLGGGVRGKEDYIYLDLWLLNSSPHTMVAYSLITKTFAQLTEPDVYYFRELDHGYTFNRGATATPSLCGGYSAVTGQFKIKTHDRYITELWAAVYEELVSPVVCNLFVTNEQISGNDYRYYMWVFNTMIGDFAESTFEYTYNGSNYVPIGNVCGGQTAFVIIRNVDAGDKLEFLVYSAETNSFTHFDTPLFYWGSGSFDAGGLMIDGYDEQTYFLYDVQTQNSFSHPVEWTQGISPGVNARGLSNYWNVFAYTEQYDDTVHVFSYTRSDGSLYAFDIIGRASNSAYRGSDFYGLLITDLGVPVETYLYSPSHNVWTVKDLESTSYRGAKGNYFYANYTNLNQTYFYDAQANQELWFSPAQMSSYVLALDSVFYMYSEDGKYTAYSMHKHVTGEYTISRFPAQQWDDYIVLCHNGTSGNRYEHLLYDGYNNIFAPLTLTPEQGTRKFSWPGGKTALVASENGYLFAYSPNASVEIESDQIISGKMQFQLLQNYPNPFNPVTIIRYSIGEREFVTLKVYDILGNEIAALVNEKKPAGTYEVSFNAPELSSGVYFYQLKTRHMIKTKKMLLLR
jgi:hypothetical protein